jgi:hypothetical protein
VEATRRVTGLLVEEAIDEGVHVLVGADGLFTCCDACADAVESVADRADLVGGQDPRLTESRGPGLGELDVEGPEADVGPDGAVHRLEFGGGAPGEASTPEFMRSSAHDDLGTMMAMTTVMTTIQTTKCGQPSRWFAVRSTRST